MEWPKNIAFISENVDSEFGFWSKLCFSVFAFVIIVSGYLVHQRVHTFLKRQVGRHINRIISCQVFISGIVSPIFICFLCGLQWTRDLSYFITDEGCYIGYFIKSLIGCYILSHSFFISLFRYICMLHPEKTRQFGLNATKVCYLRFWKYVGWFSNFDMYSNPEQL